MTGIVNIIEVVELRCVRDVKIREIIRSCLRAEYVENVQIKFNSATNMSHVHPLYISEGAIR